MEKEIQEIFNKFKHEFSGTCLVKTADEIIFSTASGFSNKAYELPNQLDTKFDTASITKTFTAVAVLLLVEKGRIHLDDKITELIDLSGTKIPDDVTIEQLLMHTSGIADDAEEEAGEDYADLFIDKPNYSIRKCSDFLPQFAYKEPNFKAGSNVRYNNCGFVLLGLAIEKITGMEFKAFVYENILEPLKLENTKFCAMDEVNPNTAEGYIKQTEKDGSFIKWIKNIYSYPPVGSPDGGIYSTVGDLDVFIRALKNGELLSEEYSKKILIPHCEYTKKYKYGIWQQGYAFEFIEIENNETFCIYKAGMNSGVEGILAYYPALDVTAVLLSNQNESLFRLFMEIQDCIYSVVQQNK